MDKTEFYRRLDKLNESTPRQFRSRARSLATDMERHDIEFLSGYIEERKKQAYMDQNKVAGEMIPAWFVTYSFEGLTDNPPILTAFLSLYAIALLAGYSSRPEGYENLGKDFMKFYSDEYPIDDSPTPKTKPKKPVVTVEEPIEEGGLTEHVDTSKYQRARQEPVPVMSAEQISAIRRKRGQNNK